VDFMTEQSLPEESIFLQALDIPAAADRDAYLARACGENSRLRAEVEALLRAHRNTGDFLDLPDAPVLAKTVGRPGAEQPVYEGAGSQIGPYKLLEQVGEGGFGVVFMAEQERPVRRRVALKVLKPGVDTRQVIARFEAERQALAMMDHPHIARVLDAGATEGGRPYFVMELVKGVPITDYCDHHQLAPRERLELFVTVCQALQHAHQKGIIHRDIKPSNVLVTLHDDKPVVKVIDFGIAKATSGQLTDKTLYTGFAQLIGTPLYMSPEQASMSGLDVDTRSDIYSLGVLLYELLTGTTPFDKSRLQEAAFDEVRRIIREEEPPKPSARISTLRNAETASAAQRCGQWKQPGPVVLGELDWIVMKALEKDRNRRYESVGGLARDVERHLRHEPVLACPPSNWYRLRKLIRRNRTACLSAAATVLVVLLGTAALAVSNYLIRQEQARTRDEQKRTEQALRLAERHAEEVRQGLARLKHANALLDRGRWYAGDGSWDDAHEAFSEAIELRPEHVSAWVNRGDLYTRLGLWDLAAADYKREMKLSEPETTLRWYQHTLLRRAIGDEEGCRQTARDMREHFAGTLRARFVEETVRSSLLVPDPDADLRHLIELCREAGPSQAGTMPYVLGAALYRAGQFEEALQQLQEAQEANHQRVLGRLSYPVLAMTHHRLGHQAEARQALGEAGRILDQWTQERYTGQREFSLVHTGGDAIWPVHWWDYLECQLLYGEAKALIDGAVPPDDPRLHVLRARALAGLHRGEQAALEFDAALRLSPQDSQIRVEAHRNRGRCCVRENQWRDAAAEFAKAVELRPDDPTLWRFQAVAHLADGDVEAHRQTCSAMLEHFAQTGDRFAAGNVLLVCVLRGDALPDMARLLPLTQVSDTLFHWGAEVRGAALYRAHRYQESVQWFEAAAKKYRRRSWDWCFLAMAHHCLGNADEARCCLAEAKRWIDAANCQTEDDPSGTQPVWGGWHEPAIAPLLLREAEGLLKEDHQP
jgi:serine/threonine protein kinase/Flp pilus assembly protein TadD